MVYVDSPGYQEAITSQGKRIVADLVLGNSGQAPVMIYGFSPPPGRCS